MHYCACVGTRKETCCSLRLINAVMKDEFVERLQTLYGPRSRLQLDEGNGVFEDKFWGDVREIFVSDDPELCELVLPRSIYSSTKAHPSKMIPHSAPKLCMMWKEVISGWKAALVRYRKSGTHESDFWDFCFNKPEVCYLQDWVGKRGVHLQKVLAGELPPKAKCNSVSQGWSGGSSSYDASKDDSTATCSGGKKPTTANSMLTAVNRLADSVSNEMPASKRQYLDAADARAVEHLQLQRQHTAADVAKAQAEAERTRLAMWDDLSAKIVVREAEVAAGTATDATRSNLRKLKGLLWRTEEQLGMIDTPPPPPPAANVQQVFAPQTTQEGERRQALESPPTSLCSATPSSSSTSILAAAPEFTGPALLPSVTHSPAPETTAVVAAAANTPHSGVVTRQSSKASSGNQ
eukprot:GHVU01155704.1.p1 GENE.GHVU01155704.1~~GHVU01155704.1.p1  ORF type:complete len:407 (+),score=55.20 GHVU01155704.1:974-2194(+)